MRSTSNDDNRSPLAITSSSAAALTPRASNVSTRNVGVPVSNQ